MVRITTISIQFDTPNLQHYSRVSNQLNHRIKYAATEQEGLKSDGHL